MFDNSIKEDEVSPDGSFGHDLPTPMIVTQAAAQTVALVPARAQTPPPAPVHVEEPGAEENLFKVDEASVTDLPTSSPQGTHKEIGVGQTSINNEKQIM